MSGDGRRGKQKEEGRERGPAQVASGSPQLPVLLGRPPRIDGQKSTPLFFMPGVGTRWASTAGPRAVDNGTRVLMLCVSASRPRCHPLQHRIGAARRCGHRDPHPKATPVPSDLRAHGEATRSEGGGDRDTALHHLLCPSLSTKED